MPTSRDRTEFGARLYEARKHARLSQAALAKMVGSGQSTLAEAEYTGQGSALTTQIANATHVRADWLATGQGAMLPPPMVIDTNVEAMASRQPVPLISWVQAGTWMDISDPFHPGEADVWMPCPERHGPRAYCLIVRGDSMFNPGGRPSYSDGDVIFVDPDVCVQPGDRAIFRLEDEKQVTFKQLVEDAGKRYLKALNPDWKPRYTEIDSHITICGKVLGKWSPD